MHSPRCGAHAVRRGTSLVLCLAAAAIAGCAGVEVSDGQAGGSVDPASAGESTSAIAVPVDAGVDAPKDGASKDASDAGDAGADAGDTGPDEDAGDAIPDGDASDGDGDAEGTGTGDGSRGDAAEAGSDAAGAGDASSGDDGGDASSSDDGGDAGPGDDGGDASSGDDGGDASSGDDGGDAGSGDDGGDSGPPPGLPVLIALGDSVTSGHHGGGTTPVVCDDAAYAYPSTVFANLENRDGETWYRPEQYVNLAHSGFATNDVLSGGTNACNVSFSSPLDAATALLRSHANAAAPNRVVMSVGANNTNWVSIVKGIGTIYYCNLQPNLTAAQCEADFANGFTGPANGQRAGCNNVTFSGWDGPNVAYQDGDAGIVQGLIAIFNGLVAADPRVQIAVVNYFDMSNTGMCPRCNPAGPYMPNVCSNAIASRLAQFGEWLDYAISASSGGANVTVITPAALNRNNAMLQQLVSTFLGPATNGWPHPNTAGHAAIGNLIVPP
jgi:hypothetical protein